MYIMEHFVGKVVVIRMLPRDPLLINKVVPCTKSMSWFGVT